MSKSCRARVEMGETRADDGMKNRTGCPRPEQSPIQLNHTQIREAGRSLSVEYQVLTTFFSKEYDDEDTPRYLLRGMPQRTLIIDRRRPRHRQQRHQPIHYMTGSSSLEDDEMPALSLPNVERPSLSEKEEEDEEPLLEQIVYHFPPGEFPEPSPPRLPMIRGGDDDDENTISPRFQHMFNRIDDYYAQNLDGGDKDSSPIRSIDRL